MKNFTQKMKSMLFSALAIFAMAGTAQAEGLSSVSDLFGKYKFTATIEYTEAGKAYQGQYKDNCEVRIEADANGIYDGQISGLAGCTQEPQRINGLNATGDSLEIFNPNGSGNVFAGLTMSTPEGMYPYGGKEPFSLKYAYNKADGSIALPDFTLGTCDHAKQTLAVMVKFTNVKLELVQLDKIEVADLSGDWHFVAGKGQWDTMGGSTLPTEFDLNIVAKDASFKTYTVKFTLGDFAPAVMDAEFNGTVFDLQLDSTALDTAEHVFIIADRYKFPDNYHAKLSFNYTPNGSLSLSSSFTIVRNMAVSAEKPKAKLQWFMAGIAKRQGGDVSEISWIGNYNFKPDAAYPVKPEVFAAPAEFSMKVEESATGLFVTEMFGEKLPMGGFGLKPDANDPTKATLVGGYDGNRYLKMVDPGKFYLVLGDMNGQPDQPVTLTMNADGSVQMANFSVLLLNYETKKCETAGAYVGVNGTLEKAPVAPDFSWAQSFKVTADVDVYNKDYEFPTEFLMTVVTNEGTGGLMLTDFLFGSIAAVNYGGAGFTVTEGNPMEANIAGGAYLKMIEPGKLYFKIADMNAQFNAIKVKADAEGNLTFDNFAVVLNNFETGETTTAAYYKNVKAVPSPATGIEAVQNESVKVSVCGNAIKLDKAQAVQVYSCAGKCVFSGVTSEVNGLVQGLYIVKTSAGVVKVFVK